jgi:hypothetical protein
VQSYYRYAEQLRSKRRSIADALAVVADFPAFQEPNLTTGDTLVAHVRIWPMRLTPGKTTALIDVFFPILSVVVSLPTAPFFTAIRDDGQKVRERFSTQLLENAHVFRDGAVRLRDGTWLRDVIITKPTHLPYKPSDLDNRILRHVITMTNSQKLCSRSVREGVLPRRLRKGMSKRRGLDYNKVKRIKRPPIKEVARYLRANDATLKNVSHQKIVDALAVFGIH